MFKLGANQARTASFFCLLAVSFLMVFWAYTHSNDVVGYVGAFLFSLSSFFVLKGVSWINLALQYVLCFFCITFPISALNPEVIVHKLDTETTLTRDIFILIAYEIVLLLLICLLKAARSTPRNP